MLERIAKNSVSLKRRRNNKTAYLASAQCQGRNTSVHEWF